MPPDTDEIRQLLHAIENEMRRIGLWSVTPPPAESFASTQPFCHDRMAFEHWLQWVFIPRMHAVLDSGGPLPERSGIAPLAELTFGETDDAPTRELVALINRFDALIARPKEN